MLKRYVLLFILLFALPAAASAWTITASSGGGGTISPKGTMAIAGTTGTSQQFTVTPNMGYQVYRVLINGVSQPVGPTYTISYNAAKLSQSITAYFQVKTYTLTPSASTGGNIYPYTAQTVNAGGSKTFSVNANAGSLIADVKVNGISVGAVSSYTFTNVQADATIDAAFTAVKADAGGNRTIVAKSLAALPPVPVLVSLDGSASTGATAYTWSLNSIPEGSLAVLSDPAAVNPTFTADKLGSYFIKLAAANGGTISTSDIAIKVVKSPEDASATCIGCHNSNTAGAAIVNGWKASTHNSGAHSNNGCEGCHIGSDNQMPGNPIDSANYSDVCNTCHTPGSPYGIYNVDLTGKAPHFQTGIADLNGYFPTASYITAGGATCADCHYHNNTINAEWAEGGHGDITAIPWKSDASHNWNNQGTDGVNYMVSPQKTNCIRCHSSRGFAQFWDSGFSNIGKVYLDPDAKTLDKASAPLTCDGCHTGSTGTVRPMPAGFTKVKSFYGYSTPTIAPAKMVTSLEFTNNKNSNICLPCHSQRAAGAGIKALFAQGAFKQYSVGTAMYPHEAQPAAIVDGKGGYEFASAQGYQDRMRHIRIGNYGTGTGYNNTGITSGNCSGCHMTSAKSHSLESVTADAITGQINGIATTLCANCHPVAFTYQDIQAKKNEFNAAVMVLGKLLVQKGFTQDGINVIAERKAFDMSRGSKDNTIAEKNIGAWFNWYLFKTADKAAYVHNPAYSRRLINDSIDWLDDNDINDSSAATIQTMAIAGTITVVRKSDLAVAQLNNPGCMGCHFGTGSTLGAEAVPGIEQAPHYNTNGAVVPGQTFTQAQFVTPNTQCNYCHGYGHGTDSPGGTIITDYAESAHGSINGMAWTDYDFKTRQGCVQCHTTKGFVDNVGATFAAGTAAPSMNAYGVAGDTTKQVLGCNACHSSTTWKTSVRNSGAVTVPLGVAGNTPKAVMTFPDVGESNVCIMCHASRENGESLIAGNPTNAAGKGFTNPHYLSAAAVFYGKGGFQFYTSGVRYNTYGAAGKTGKAANWSHGRLGMDNYSGSGNNDLAGVSNNTGSKGQCVACHLGPKNTHTFGASEVANASMAGATNLVSGKAMTRTCFGCHKANGDSPVATIEQFIDEEKEIWYRMFDFYKWQLAQYGINYTDAYPYFSGSFDATIGTTFGGAGVIDNNKTRGTAMNLKLLLAEKGSHVHNRSFGRALIADSIVYLQKGDVGDRTVVYPDQNQVIKFTDYSTARPTSYPGQVGPDISITTLKSYLTRTAPGGFIRR